MPENVYLHLVSWVAPSGIAFNNTAMNTLYNNATTVFADDNDGNPIYPAEEITKAEIIKIEFNGNGDRKYAVLYRYDEGLPSVSQSAIAFFSPYFDSTSKAMIVAQFDNDGIFLGINRLAISGGTSTSLPIDISGEPAFASPDGNYQILANNGETAGFTVGTDAITLNLVANGHTLALGVSASGDADLSFDGASVLPQAGWDASIPTDITGDASANTISLYHDGTAISGQTPLQLKTINGQSIIGTGDITIPAATSAMLRSAPMSSYATKYVSGVSATKSQVFVVDTQIEGEGIRILSVDIPTQTDVFFGAPYYADGTWKVKAINYGDDFTNATVEIMYAN